MRRSHSALFGAMAISNLACISTDLSSISPFPVCNSIGGEGGGSAAVVEIVTHRNGSVTFCNGVVIAPKLVLTALGCVAEGSDPLQSDPVELVEPIAGPASGELSNAGVADYSAICDGDDGWALREHGNFGGRPGDLVAPASIDVYRLPSDFDASDPDSYQIVKAADVLTSRSASRCRDDIAVLLLEEPLATEPATLSLGIGGAVGERVTLTNFCSGPEGLPVVEETPSQVLEITRDAGRPLLPPRSLLLTGQLENIAPGGAVFLALSNSLIGMIVSGTKASCDTQTSEGTTFATHLSSYRGLLFDAANAAQEVLRLDPDANDASLLNVRACSEP